MDHQRHHFRGYRKLREGVARFEDESGSEHGSNGNLSRLRRMLASVSISEDHRIMVSLSERLSTSVKRKTDSLGSSK